MKCDVIVPFYNQFLLYPILAWGFAQNKDYINQVIVVKDGLFNPGERDALTINHPQGIPLTLLDHPKDGFGAHVSVKQGITAATTEYVAYHDADVVLAPHALRKMLEDADTELALYGLAHDISKRVTVRDFPDPPIMRHDLRNDGKAERIKERYLMCRDSFVLVDREAYLRIGGHDTAYKGYGLLDYDLALRWMIEYGDQSVELGRGESYHIGGTVRNRLPSEDNQKRFEAVLAAWRRGQHATA